MPYMTATASLGRPSTVPGAASRASTAPGELRGRLRPGGPSGLPAASVMRTRTGVGFPSLASTMVTDRRASVRTGAAATAGRPSSLAAVAATCAT